MAIAVDFDGVIHAYSKGWGDGSIYDEPAEAAMWGLSVLMSKAPVFVFTSRKPSQVAYWIEDRSGHSIECTTWMPRTWCGKRKPFWSRRDLVLVTNRKLPATIYIDDRAYRFNNWYDTVQDYLKTTR